MSDLKPVFVEFAKFGDTRADGSTITLTQIDKWFKQAKILDKKITTTDTGICFNKFKSKTMDYETFLKFLQQLATDKNVAVEDLKAKLLAGGPPGMTKVTATSKVGAVDRLTDTSKYTGTHKERFDETGKGKGKTGREDLSPDDGYVSGYKMKDTYSKTH